MIYTLARRNIMNPLSLNSSLPRINIALDIDGFLGTGSVLTAKEAKYYKNKGGAIAAINTIYLFAGVKEFTALLFQTERFRVSFFSAGIELRNRIFVDCLLSISLEDCKYKNTKNKVCIRSRTDLVKPSQQDRDDHYNKYGFMIGVEKNKDLSKILEDGDILENAVLMDNDLRFVASGQGKNILHVKDGSQNIGKMENKLKKYTSDGYRLLSCIFILSENLDYQKLWVNKGTKIGLIKTKDSFEICFLNKETHEFQKITTSKDTHELLIIQLNEAYKNQTSCYILEIEDKDLNKKIYQLVDQYGGITKKIHRAANRIFYATGVLFTALEQSESNNIPITEALFQMQYRKKADGDAHEPNFVQLRKRDEFYLYGLEKLREINPDLQLITPHSFKEAIEK